MPELNQNKRSRIFSDLWASVCSGEEQAMDIGGMHLVPDSSKAYTKFVISHGLPMRTAYGTALHPGTVANSHKAMLHQVFNLGHMMRSYDGTPEKKEIPRDHILGSIVAVELTNPTPPKGSWQYATDPKDSTGIRAAAVMHKAAERVPKLLGDHLSGRKKMTVSMEVEYSLAQSGFMVGNRDKAKKGAKDLMDKHSPSDFTQNGIGYVPAVEAPETLLDVYDFDKGRIKADWDGLPVSMLMGGINGQVHYYGVGLVGLGAEREAEVQAILASDPDRLFNEESDQPRKDSGAGLSVTSDQMEELLAWMKAARAGNQTVTELMKK